MNIPAYDGYPQSGDWSHTQLLDDREMTVAAANKQQINSLRLVLLLIHSFVSVEEW